MIVKIFSIKDTCIHSFGPLFNSPTIEGGMRLFRDVCLFGDENNRYKRSPEDFVLHVVGEFDDEKGELLKQEPMPLITAMEVLSEYPGGKVQ